MKIFILIILLTAAQIFAQTEFGDTLYSFNAGVQTPTPDYGLTGIEYAENHFWLTGFDPGDFYNHKIYKFTLDGELVEYFPQGIQYAAYYDLAYDGEYLYITDVDSIKQFDINSGVFTGEGFPTDFDYLLPQGVAYDPSTDHFWVVPQKNAQTQILYEMDRAGNKLSSYAIGSNDYTTALTWDTLSPGGPYLWTLSNEDLGNYQTRNIMKQFNPSSGTFTGIEIELINRSYVIVDGPSGFTFSDEIVDGTATMAVLQTGSLNPNDGLDWVVVYDADLSDFSFIGPQISSNPSSIQNSLIHGDTALVEVKISNSGNTRLNWSAYIENNLPGNGENNLGDTLSVFDLTTSAGNSDLRFEAVEYARGNIWGTARLGFDDRLLFKIDSLGNIIDTFTFYQNNPQLWNSIATDGNILFFNDRFSINIWSLDSNQVSGFILKSSFNVDAMTYDPNKKYLYLANSIGAIKVIDLEGDEQNFFVTDYGIEGIAWDNWSPGGPFIWITDTSNSQFRMVRVDPTTMSETGVEFNAQNISGSDQPEALAVTPSFRNGKLSLLSLQRGGSFGNFNYNLAVYDLDETPPPAWIKLHYPTVGTIQPDTNGSLFVKLSAIAEDTLTSAVVNIYSNDINQPVFEIPVNFEMLSAQTVPVELLSLTYEFDETGIVINWSTATETNNQGFEIFRNNEKIAFVNGKGTSTEIQKYRYVDAVTKSSDILYKIYQIDFDGTRTLIGSLDLSDFELPKSFALSQNYPNPFNPATKINFAIPEASDVSITIYNLIGQKVAQVANGFFNAGNYEIEFNASELSSGLYLYKMKAGNFTAVKKMTLIK